MTTPPLKRSPRRAKRGRLGLNINGLFTRIRVSALPKRLPACTTAITRKVLRLSGSLKLALASPLASVCRLAVHEAKNLKLLRRSMPSKAGPPPPPPRTGPFRQSCVGPARPPGCRRSAHRGAGGHRMPGKGRAFDSPSIAGRLHPRHTASLLTCWPWPAASRTCRSTFTGGARAVIALVRG